MSSELPLRAELARVAADLARSQRLLARALDRLASEQTCQANVPAPTANVPGNATLKAALLAAATAEECSRKALFRRAGRGCGSNCYAALRDLIAEGKLRIGPGGGVCLP